MQAGGVRTKVCVASHRLLLERCRTILYTRKKNVYASGDTPQAEPVGLLHATVYSIRSDNFYCLFFFFWSLIINVDLIEESMLVPTCARVPHTNRRVALDRVRNVLGVFSSRSLESSA